MGVAQSFSADSSQVLGTSITWATKRTAAAKTPANLFRNMGEIISSLEWRSLWSSTSYCPEHSRKNRSRRLACTYMPMSRPGLAGVSARVASFRFSRRAETDLLSVAAYTLRTWGEDQTIRYIDDLGGVLPDACR